jgi:hypothetical protein
MFIPDAATFNSRASALVRSPEADVDATKIERKASPTPQYWEQPFC